MGSGTGFHLVVFNRCCRNLTRGCGEEEEKEEGKLSRRRRWRKKKRGEIESERGRRTTGKGSWKELRIRFRLSRGGWKISGQQQTAIIPALFCGAFVWPGGAAAGRVISLNIIIPFKKPFSSFISPQPLQLFIPLLLIVCWCQKYLDR